MLAHGLARALLALVAASAVAADPVKRAPPPRTGAANPQATGGNEPAWPWGRWRVPAGDPPKAGRVNGNWPDIPSGYIRCGQSWQTGYHMDLYTIFAGWPAPSDPEFGQKFMYLPPHTCTRVACIATSGVYLCNSRNHTLMLETAFNATWAVQSPRVWRGPSAVDAALAMRDDSVHGCCEDPWRVRGMSSEWRSTGPNGVPGWLAIAGYANCGDDRISPWPGGGPGKWDGKGSPYNGRCHQMDRGNWPNTEGDADTATAPDWPHPPLTDTQMPYS